MLEESRRKGVSPRDCFLNPDGSKKKDWMRDPRVLAICKEFDAALKRAGPLPPVTERLRPGVHLMALGRFLSLMKSLGDSEALLQAESEWNGGAFLDLFLEYSDTETPFPTLPFATEWADAGFPVVELGHRLAAAFMLTDVPDLTDMKPPWGTFYIKVPNHALQVDGMPDVTHVLSRVGKYNRPGSVAERGGLLTHSRDSQSTWHFAVMFAGGGFFDSPVAELQCGSYGFDPADLNVLLPDPKPLLSLGRNLVASVVAAMEAGAAITEKKWTPRDGKRRTTGVAPVGTRFIVGGSIQVDLQPQVKEVLLGKHRRGASPTVQFVVRGHWRNQVCGPNRAERKRIWIKPFWKGPEESRALLRAHSLDKPSPPW
jgi:hypothetical protein